MKKKRDQEALLILTKLNRHSGRITFVDTCLELEELKNSTKTSLSNRLQELLQWKYIYRQDDVRKIMPQFIFVFCL